MARSARRAISGMARAAGSMRPVARDTEYPRISAAVRVMEVVTPDLAAVESSADAVEAAAK